MEVKRKSVSRKATASFSQHSTNHAPAADTMWTLWKQHRRLKTRAVKSIPFNEAAGSHSGYMCNRQERSSERLTCRISSQRFTTEKRHTSSVDGNHRRRGAVKSKPGWNCIRRRLGSWAENLCKGENMRDLSGKCRSTGGERGGKKHQVLHLYAWQLSPSAAQPYSIKAT